MHVIMQKTVGASCFHKIKIKNLQENDLVKCSQLLIISGSVSSTENCKSLIHLNAENQSLSNNVCPITGDFKFILDLSINWCVNTECRHNTLGLHFKYCNTELQTQISLELASQPYRVQPLYILCRDEQETDLAQLHCRKIDLNLRLIQALYSDCMQKAGLPRKTFHLNGPCEIYRADIDLLQALAADEQTLWTYFAEEFLRKNRFEEGGGARKLKLVAFIGCTRYDGSAVVASGDFSYANIKEHLQANAALGGGDLALFGSAFFYAWPDALEQIVPCFLNQKPVDPAIEADESNYRRTYGGVYASTLGAVCHEIGHIFELGHDDGIMGQGLDYVNRVLTVNKRTENLPKRVFSNESAAAKPSRMTNFVKRNQNFLENYREQRKNDGFYFTRNCALILQYHKWFNNNKGNILEKCDENNFIKFDRETGVIRTSTANALNIIEIRSNCESRVERFYEITDPNKFEYKIPSEVISMRQTTHHLFVTTKDGLSQRFDLAI